METLIRQHGPLGAMTVIFLLAGNLINQNTSETNILSPSKWCNLNSTSDVELPQGLEQVVLSLSVLIPMLPFILNKPNDVNIEMFKSHLMGQSSGFGLSEMIRHFVELPEPSFLTKCNITSQECNYKISKQVFTLLSKNNTLSLCNKNFTSSNSKELFNSVHNFPNFICVMLGSSLMTFISILWFWQRLNDHEQSLFQNSSILKIFTKG